MLYPDFDELVQLGRKTLQSSGLTERSVISTTPGDYTSPFRGQGLEFEEVRKYVFGDDIRNIDWRVTARTGMPHLKVFTQECERTVVLCIDASAKLRFGTRGTFKSVQAARAAAILGWSANRSHDRLGSVVFGDVPEGIQFFPPTRSRRSLWKSLKLLSREHAPCPAPVSLEDTLQFLCKAVPTGALVFIISGFDGIAAHLEKSLVRLHRRCDIVIVRINDPADHTIPPVGMMRFAGNGGTKLRVNTDSLSGREAYKQQWQQNRQALEKIASQRRLGIIDLHTDRDIWSSIMLGLQRLKAGKGVK